MVRFDTRAYDEKIRRPPVGARDASASTKWRASLLDSTRRSGEHQFPAWSGEPTPALSPAVVQVSGLAGMRMAVMMT
jgi:hypothetical protein